MISSISAALTLIWATGYSGLSVLTILGFTAAVFLNDLPEKIGVDVGLLNSRRINQLTIINSWFLIAASISYAVTSLLPVFAAIMTAAAFLRNVIYFALAGERRNAASPFLTLSMLLEILPAIFFLSKMSYGISLLLSYAIGRALAWLLILTLDKNLLIRKISSFRLVSAILALLLEERSDWLEKIVEKLDDERAIQVDVIALRRREAEKAELAILIPTFHPGPFRSFGSSGLIYSIAEKLKSIGVEAVFFKGLSNHETNIISPEDCERIVNGVAEAISSNGEKGYHKFMSEPVFLQNGKVKSILISIGEAKLAFLTMHPNGMEDISPSILDELNGDLIPVDCHNSFSDAVKDLDGGSLRSIISLLKEASKIPLTRSSPILLGYTRAHLSGRSLEDGIGRLGISAITLKTENSLVAIIALDGNNCLPEVRSRIVEELGALGVNVVEVLTTDTHLVNGLRFGGRGYHPLGEIITVEELAEKSREAVKEALRSMKPMEASWIRLKFDGVKVTSSSFFKEAALRASQGLKIFFAFLAAAVIAGAVAGALLL